MILPLTIRVDLSNPRLLPECRRTTASIVRSEQPALSGLPSVVLSERGKTFFRQTEGIALYFTFSLYSAYPSRSCSRTVSSFLIRFAAIGM